MGGFIIKDTEEKIYKLLQRFFDVPENTAKKLIIMWFITTPLILLAICIVQVFIENVETRIQILDKVKAALIAVPAESVLSLYFRFSIFVAMCFCAFSIGIYFFSLSSSLNRYKNEKKSYPVFVLYKSTVEIKEIDTDLFDSKRFNKNEYRTKGILQYSNGKKECIYICTAPKSNIKGTKVENRREYMFLSIILCNVGELGLSVQISQIDIDGVAFHFHSPVICGLDIMSDKRQLINLELHEVFTNESICIDTTQENMLKFKTVSIDIVSKDIYGESFLQKINLERIESKKISYKSSGVELFAGQIKTLT